MLSSLPYIHTPCVWVTCAVRSHRLTPLGCLSYYAPSRHGEIFVLPARPQFPSSRPGWALSCSVHVRERECVGNNKEANIEKNPRDSLSNPVLGPQKDSSTSAQKTEERPCPLPPSPTLLSLSRGCAAVSRSNPYSFIPSPLKLLRRNQRLQGGLA